MLQVFKSLPVVDSVSQAAQVPGAFERDTVTLGWEDRLKPRGRRRSDAGIEFGLALPRGSVLRSGDILVVRECSLAVAVVELDEPVFIVEGGSAAALARAAYHLGNAHQPIMIVGDEILCPDGRGVRQFLEYHQILFRRAIRAFTPDAGIVDHRHPL